MRTIDEFEEINLDPFILEKKVAIRCANESEALHLLAAMMSQYPDRTKWWTFPDHNFPEIPMDNGYCYSLDEGNGRLLHGDTEWHESNKYFILDFQELLNKTETREYDELDDISALLL